MIEKPTPYQIIVMWFATTIIRDDKATTGENAKRLLSELDRHGYQIVPKERTGQ